MVLMVKASNGYNCFDHFQCPDNGRGQPPRRPKAGGVGWTELLYSWNGLWFMVLPILFDSPVGD